MKQLVQSSRRIIISKYYPQLYVLIYCLRDWVSWPSRNVSWFWIWTLTARTFYDQKRLVSLLCSCFKYFRLKRWVRMYRISLEKRNIAQLDFLRGLLVASFNFCSLIPWIQKASTVAGTVLKLKRLLIWSCHLRSTTKITLLINPEKNFINNILNWTNHKKFAQLIFPLCFDASLYVRFWHYETVF